MVQIGIETVPEPFEPDSGHLNTYSRYRNTAEKAGVLSGHDHAVASAILALAAQVARLADVAEYQAMTGGRA